MSSKLEVVEHLLQRINGDEFTDEERVRLHAYYEVLRQNGGRSALQQREEVLNEALRGRDDVDDVMQIFRVEHARLKRAGT